MTQFKVGDVVECVDSSENLFGETLLDEGVDRREQLIAAARRLEELESALAYLPEGWVLATVYDEDGVHERYSASWVDRDANEEHFGSGKLPTESILELASELGWDPKSTGCSDA